ncbi:PGPGW domain-containing protein [Thalassotalea aquiviva]|uniref:PGPGW domain-containing protein n=1 Tax=Thalassotalea aquiviva TaxID=3242415 RepID=UPI00352AA144
MRHLKTKLYTALGAVLLLIGIVFIVLPGPAILFIPLGLALLSFEYPKARAWLKQYQRYSSKAARKTDQFVSRCRQRIS